MSDHHSRKQIRDALVALLMNLPTTGDRVFPGRSYPVMPEEYPCLCVYARGGSSDADDEGLVTERTLERNERITIEGLVRVASADPDDKLDQIALEVERQIATDEELKGENERGLVDPLTLIVTDLGAVLLGEARIASIKLTYRAVHRTNAADPAVVVTNG